MAVPIAAIIKAAQVTHSVVKAYVPGGWKTVITVGIITALVVPITIIYSLVAGFGLNPAPFTVCGTSNVDGGEDSHAEDGGNAGGNADSNVNTGYGRHKAPNVPFPTEDSASIVNPVKGGVSTSSYGPRTSIFINGFWTNKFHDGTDYGAPSGAPIVAMADGTVSMSISATGKFEGSMMEIQHQIDGKKYTSAYRHIQGKSIKFKVGDTVKAGQQIAAVGQEGLATGPHLHFVIAQGPYHRYNSANSPAGTVNAIKFLKDGKAGNPSGGLEGDDFSEPYNPSEDASDEECGEGGGTTRLPGDGTNKWNAFENGEFDKDNIKTQDGVTLFSEAANAYSEMAKKYKEETKKTFSIKTSYLSLADQKKLHKDDKQIEEAGQSVFGWARLLEFNDMADRDSDAYKWLEKNAGEYGWEQPKDYLEGGSTDSPAIWGYVGGGTAVDIPPAGNASVESNRALAKKIMEEDYPEWSKLDYACLVVIWHRESTWNHKAANPTTAARGIPQAMMSLHFGNKHTWRSNPKSQEYLDSPEVQIRWGFNHIKKNKWFSTPCEASAFWNETDPAKKGGIAGHWY